MSKSLAYPINRVLSFDGPQPAFYGAPKASAKPMRGDSFVGDTRQGGSCNASALSINPHCNGTHTECVGHLTDERINVLDCAPNHVMRAVLVSVLPISAKQCDDKMATATQKTDLIITRGALKKAMRKAGSTRGCEALIIRCLPNGAKKINQRYVSSDDYPVLSVSALDLIIERGFGQLLVDTPSLDRLEDGGRLQLHRRFWNLPKRGHKTRADTRRSSTITEMIYVPDHIADGLWQLSLQLAPFEGDAVPSRPILYPLTSKST